MFLFEPSLRILDNENECSLLEFIAWSEGKMSFDGGSKIDRGGKSCSKSSTLEMTVAIVPFTRDIDLLLLLVPRDLFFGS